jgi:hypothetical protein
MDPTITINIGKCLAYLKRETKPDPQDIIIKKGKVIPLHAMVAYGGRGGIAPTHT